MENVDIKREIEIVMTMISVIPSGTFGPNQSISTSDVCELLEICLESPDVDSLIATIEQIFDTPFESWLDNIKKMAGEAIELLNADHAIKLLLAVPGGKFEENGVVIKCSKVIEAIKIWRASKDKDGIDKVYEYFSECPFCDWLRNIMFSAVDHIPECLQQELNTFERTTNFI